MRNLKRPCFMLAAALPAALLLAACSGSGGTARATISPSPVEGALSNGLIAYVSDKGVGVLDPQTGTSTVVAPLPAFGAFRVAGPVWGPSYGTSDPVIYFTIHDDRPAERRTTAGVIPYDWLFMVDPFAGSIEPIAASADLQSEGPFGLAANSHYLTMTVGCCTSYEVDALDLTRPLSAFKVLNKPTDQATLFTEGAAPGLEGLIAVRAFGTGAWYWLNPGAGVLHAFPLKLGPDDGPIAFSPDGTMVAVSMPTQGPVIQSINTTVPVASPSSAVTGPVTSATSPSPASPSPVSAPRRVNSKLPHADALAWSPNAHRIALAVNGEIQVYDAAGKDGTPPANRYLTGRSVTGLDWSGSLSSKNLGLIAPSKGPQSFVDALLAATKLPAAADTPAQRPLTKVYLWQFDSTKPSPIATITEPSAAILEQHPPLAAGVAFHHWTASASWALLGGCYRYRVVIAGSIPPTASTIGLAGNAPCTAVTASPTPTK